MNVHYIDITNSFVDAMIRLYNGEWVHHCGWIIHTFNMNSVDTWKRLLSQYNTISLPDSVLVRPCISGNVEVVRYLVEQSAADSQRLIHADSNAAVKWAVWYGHLQVVKYLCEQGAHIDYELVDFSASNGDVTMIQYLVEKGADVDDQALVEAAINGQIDVVRYLVEEQRLDPRANDDEAFRMAVTCRQVHVMEFFIERGCIPFLYERPLVNVEQLLPSRKEHLATIHYT
jgi:hypothetical protein